MEIKFKLYMDKAVRATVTSAASYALRHISEGTKYAQLAFVEFFALIFIIAILYSNRPAPLAKRNTPLVCK